MTTAGLRAERARRSLREFVRQAWHVVEPQTRFVPGWHLDAICEHLEAATRGELRSLIVNVPPRHAKSLLVSVFWPCWVWASRPSTRWLYASYAASLSVRDSLKCRRLIESPWFQRSFGHAFKLAGDQNLKTRFDNDRMGYRIATSVGGSITGEGGDFLVIDDPHNVVEGESEVIRKGVLDWHDQVFSTRANDPRTAVRVLVMQRVHESDLAGHLLRQGGWELLRLPAERDEKRCRTSIGWEDPREKEGELLWPDRFGAKEIADLKTQLGTYGSAGQLQQIPSPASGGLFKRDWFRYYERGLDKVRLGTLELGLSAFSRFCTVDLATSTKTSADYTVIATWGLYHGRPHELVLLDLDRRRLEGPDIIPAIEKAMQAWRVSYVGIEKTGFQLSLVQQARREGIPVREIETDKDKIARAMGATPHMEAGHVWFPAGAAFLGDLEHELLTFPQGDHDDMVDCLSAAVLQLAKSSGWSIFDLNTDGWERVREERDPWDERDDPLAGYRVRNPFDGLVPPGNPFDDFFKNTSARIVRPGEFYR
ncbi:MAG: phage terminase large subunit [Candidatus Brocadiae bacterium]|nr:phage terminase large subunit [Candidatus Brocadiia bacterium]